ncbi:MAG TPA: ATP-binding protein [Bacteroidales bacterium]|nr:ATP-binding protein [Bacteroidales bacterium]
MNQIAIISGKGGTGKSSISAAFATIERNNILADCDVDAANLYLIFNPVHEEEVVYIGSNIAVINYSKCTNCGNCFNICRFDAIEYIDGIITIKEISCDGCFLCYRICSENAIHMQKNDKSRMYAGAYRNGKMVYGILAPGEENSGKLVSLIREKAKKLAEENNCQTIILDGPPGVGCPVISTISGVSKVVIVTEPTMSGLYDMIRAVEITQKFNIIPTIIINKYTINLDMMRQISDWCKNHNLQVAGCIPFSNEIVEAMVQKKSIIELDENSEISKIILKIYETLIQ